MENTINLLGKQTKDTTTNEYQKHLLQYACTVTRKNKTADGTKNARRSVGQNARFASGNLTVK